MLQAGSVLVFARESGDGPFRNGVHNCTGLDTSSVPVSGASVPHQPTQGFRPPALTSEAERGVMNPATQSTGANPEVEPAVSSPAAPSPVAGPGGKSTVASTAVEPPAVASPVVASLIPNPAVQSSVASVAAESPAGSPAILSRPSSMTGPPALLSRTSSLTIPSPVADPTVQPQEIVKLSSPKQGASSE